jgi:hypothetical protein
MPAHRPLLAAATALLLAGCGHAIAFDRDPGVAIPRGATYAYADEDHSRDPAVDPHVNNSIVQGRLQRAVDRELGARGYRRVDNPMTADFLVRYFWKVRESTELVAAPAPVMDPWMGWGWGWGYGWGWGGMATTMAPVTVREKTFFLDMVDQQSGRLAWRATWAGKPVGRAPTQQELDEGARALLADAPAAR